MFNKNDFFKINIVLVLIGTMLFPSTILMADISGPELKNIFASKELLSNTTTYNISFVMVTRDKSSDPNQGMVFMNCSLTCLPHSTFAMKITYNYEHTPVFARPGTSRYRPIDYDEEGNLIVWRPIDKYIIFTPDRNETRTRMKSFFVDPNNQILNKGGVQTMVHRYPPGDRKYTYEFNQFELALGRGLSRKIGTVNSIKSLSSGLVRITAQSSNESSQSTWELTVDPNLDYLARKATFTMEGRPEPIEVITSSGVIEKDGIKLAKYGTYKFSDYLDLSVEATEISKEDGPNKLYEEVLSHLNSPLPPGASIVDLRGEKHTMTSVK